MRFHLVNMMRQIGGHLVEEPPVNFLPRRDNSRIRALELGLLAAVAGLHTRLTRPGIASQHLQMSIAADHN